MTTSDTYHRFLSVIDGHKGIIYKVANSFCADAEERPCAGDYFAVMEIV